MREDLLYEGNFDVAGSFPFFIDEDNSNNRVRAPEPDLVGVK
ncbi:MAG: hypothetical protein Q7R87_02805 [Nanoarchaeota archaeon]|nr:hypothetical protein [Nanoarchaeota archaeon]